MFHQLSLAFRLLLIIGVCSETHITEPSVNLPVYEFPMEDSPCLLGFLILFSTVYIPCTLEFHMLLDLIPFEPTLLLFLLVLQVVHCVPCSVLDLRFVIGAISIID